MQAKEPKKFITIDGNALMAQEFEPLRFSQQFETLSLQSPLLLLVPDVRDISCSV